MSFLGEKELKEQIKSIIPQYRPKFIDSNKYELCEPPRDCRRLNFLREYDNENTKLYP